VAVTKYAVELLNASLAGKPSPAAPAPPAPPDEVKNAADYAGTYTAPDGKYIIFEARGAKLLFPVAGQMLPLEPAGRDLFVVKHDSYDRYLLGFSREGGRVTEVFHGADWYAGPAYTGPRAFTHPKEWEGFAGHYHCDSPWYGDTRVVLRKGRLYLDGVQPLVLRPDGKFGVGDPEGPDWINFESVTGGRAMRLSYSGIVFRRTFTP
jgi:hypothetical protein